MSVCTPGRIVGIKKATPVPSGVIDRHQPVTKGSMAATEFLLLRTNSRGCVFDFFIRRPAVKGSARILAEAVANQKQSPPPPPFGPIQLTTLGPLSESSLFTDV